VTEPNENPPDLSPLTREALAWVVRLRSGDATKADLERLERWRAQSAEHEAAFREAARLWRGLKKTADDISLEKGSGRRNILAPAQWMMSRRALVGGAIAAAAGAYLIYQPPLELWPSLSELRADYRTGKGERRDITVADGIALTLNTQTSIVMLPAGQDDTNIELISGEAAVAAARSGRRSISIQSLGVRVVANRANFNVRCVDNAVSVTCFEGVVDVEGPLSLVPLRAGQQVSFSQAYGLGQASAADLEEASAWQRGLLIVNNRPLSEVVSEVNRYRSGHILVLNQALANRLVNGSFHLEHLDNFPSQVQQLFGAAVRALPGGITLLS
jgi:transmembrane sensor